jgi:stage II sporulation protein D
MKTSTKRSAVREKRSVRRWAERATLLGALALAAGCGPLVMRPEPTAPVPLPRAEPAVRVGIVVDTAQVEIGSTAGLSLLDAGAGHRQLGRAPANARWTVRALADGNLEVGGPQGRVAAVAGPLLARPEGGGTVLIGGNPYRGEALIQLAGPGRLTLINVVDMEAYLLGVVPHEIGPVGEDLLEAAKAQAVAARTYAVAHRGRRMARGFDYYATVQDQVYRGSGGETAITNRSVHETRGEVLLHQGTPVEAYYHSTCAGRTAAIEEVWPAEPRPYLVSVVDVNPRTGVAYDHFSNRFRWSQRWTAEQLTAILNRTLADSLPAGVRSVGEIRDVRVLERTPSGRVANMRIETTTGRFHVGRDRVRWILLTPEGRALNSSLFDVELVRDAAGRVTEIVANGGGWGHGIGMCQVGAMGRARDGQNYRTILTTYYPGTEIRRLY